MFACTPASSKSGMAVQNTTKKRKERIGRLLRMHGDKREELAQARRGVDRRCPWASFHDHWRHAL